MVRNGHLGGWGHNFRKVDRLLHLRKLRRTHRREGISVWLGHSDQLQWDIFAQRLPPGDEDEFDRYRLPAGRLFRPAAKRRYIRKWIANQGDGLYLRPRKQPRPGGRTAHRKP